MVAKKYVTYKYIKIPIENIPFFANIQKYFLYQKQQF